MIISIQEMLQLCANMMKSLTAAFALIFAGFTFGSESTEATPPACPTIIMSGSNATCYGTANGSATVTVITGGSGNYTYTWSNGTVTSGGTTSTINSLAVGTYTVNVRDNGSGCTVLGAFVVSSPDPISITGTTTNVNCFNGSSGAIDISVIGGTGPYSYSWSNGATTQDLTGIPAGTYTVTVNAPNASCNAQRTYTITQPIEALSATGDITDVNCFGNNTGAVNLTVWGGTPPYAFLWDGGQTTEDVGNLNAGLIGVQITDSKGCQLNLSFDVDQPNPLGAVASSTDVLCFGESTGSVSVTVSEGTAPYSFSWQNSVTLFAQNSSSIFNVPADSYLVTVTDNNGCQTTATVDVNEPPLLTSSAIVTNVSCHGGSDGQIDVTTTGGTLPYNFVWENSVPTVVGNTEDLLNVVAEVYTLSITDFNGCFLELTREVTQPLTPVDVVAVVNDVLCFGENTGSIDLTVSGGTAPYTYSWSSGQSTEDISNLLAGSYSFNVLDANNCPFNGTETVGQPAAPLTVTNVVNDVSCFGGSDGSIDLTVTGGTAPYTYEWSNSDFELSVVSQDLNNYPAEDYRYEVTDANGCKAIDTLTIAEPTLLESSVTGVNILCHGGNNGSVDLTVWGGSTPYIYLWNNGAVTEDINTLIAGYYEVLVTDDHGCTTMSSITLTEPMDSLSFTYSVSHVLCNDGTDGSIEIEVAGGTPNYNYDWSNGGVDPQIQDLTAGWYEFLVTDANGCTIGDSIEVTQPDALTLNEVITAVSCNGMGDGSIDISPVGGTTPYDFTWFNSDYALSTQTEDLIDFPADIYQVEIVDSNDCFYEMFFEITQPDSLKVTYTVEVVSCFGESDGNIYVDITGGNPGYTTTWSNGATTQDLLNVPFGVYELDVVDTQGCMDSITVEIIQPDSLIIDFTHEPISCIDQYDGIAYATPSGGNGGYYYQWSNGSMSSMADSLNNEFYYLTVTDVLGCTAYDSVFITRDESGCIDPVNAFTPNGDVYNDTWVIDNMYLYPDAEVQIFNKWGNLIHYQKGEYEPWDGVIKGQPAPSEVYYWIINLNKEGREVLKGNISIVR